ncbi:facilitated trehalose transporter Tret1-like [Rhopalosiphum maidis]|uniref:facilitated trehalose transporter Tret1-like n=1 Tax=Rhopalosiphum maidis TaxID=43146 RepID=UPI000EFE5A5B|nr:facilitated trehalose transporter Tret1-like [Rhopalosiphum maidis]
MSSKIDIGGDNPVKNYGPMATFAQLCATIAQSFLLVGLGMELTMSTIVIQDLYNNPKSEFSLTTSQVSWYGSILFVFHPTGSFLSGFLQERFGRKRCMVLANIPSILGWIMLYYTHSVASLYASTVLMGLSIGFSEAPILSYVGEITEPRIRGMMASLASTAGMLGMFLIYLLGYFFEWRIVALLSTLCPITCICLVMLIPESPIWLIAKGKNEKAKKALCWLRGWVNPEIVKTEYLELIRYNELSGIRNDKVNIEYDSLSSKLSQLKDPSVYRPLGLVMIVFFISYIVCLLPCKPYFSQILNQVDLSNDQSLLLVFFSILQMAGCIILFFIINYLGKRFLTVMSVMINTILLIAFGLYIIAINNNYIQSTPWFPKMVLSGISLFGTSISTLPWMLISEIFPNKSRGVAAGSCAALSYLLMFIITKSYLSIEIFLTLEYTMLLFGGIGLFGLVYLYLYLPETENKTLLEIEEYFK